MHTPELQAHQRPLSYADKLEARPVSDIRLVVIHCTELPDLEMARDYAETIRYPASGTGNSGHFYVDRDGRVEQWVPLNRIAHHVRDHNLRTVGIELVNLGRYPDWLDSNHQDMTEPYPLAQIDALVGLVLGLSRKLPALRFVTGHERLDTEQVRASDNPEARVYRKRDPGPLFPWLQVLNDIPLQPLPEGATIR